MNGMATPYTYGYYRELSPAYQKFCLLMRGFDSPPLDQNSRHCELAYGQGVSINIHAAANPGKYFGTDFNPTQAAHANELRRASGADAQFFDDSFEQFLDRLNENNMTGGGELSNFDTIGLHGIWSWVSADNQKHIVEIMRRHLKAGGIVYNSYNCFPGWAPAAPLRELLALYDKFIGNTESNTFKRVDNALKFADDLLAAKPSYAFRVPELNSRLQQLKAQNHDYLAHEYLNQDWTCMYFAEIAEILSTAKLNYACTTEIIETVDQFNLTPDAQKFLNAIANPIVREQARDYFVGRQFRKDLYVRGLKPLPPQERMRRLLNTRFVLATVDKLPMQFKVALGDAGLPGNVCYPMLEYLAADNFKPKSFAELFRQRRLNVQALESMLVPFVQNQQILPCHPEEIVKEVKPKCDALNDYLCRRAETSTEIMFLASPVTGMGFPVGRIEQLFVPMAKRGISDIDELAREVWANLDSRGERMIKDGKMLQSVDDNINEIKSIAKRFAEKQLPILRALQIA